MKDIFGNEDNEIVLMRKYYILHRRLQEIVSSRPYWFNKSGSMMRHMEYYEF